MPVHAYVISFHLIQINILFQFHSTYFVGIMRRVGGHFISLTPRKNTTGTKKPPSSSLILLVFQVNVPSFLSPVRSVYKYIHIFLFHL